MTKTAQLPCITIITSTYNCANALNKTADSIRNQPYKNIQWIIADGASSRETIDVIKNNRDIVTDWFSEPDSGIYDAWNKACELIKGDWVVFLGAGDLIGERWLEFVSRQDFSYDLIYGDLETISIDGDISISKSIEWDKVLKNINRKMCLPHPGLAHHRRLFKNSHFDSEYKVCADWIFLASSPLRKGKYSPNHIQATFIQDGISSSMAGLPIIYKETRQFLATQGLKMPLKDNIRYNLLFSLGKRPFLYKWLRLTFRALRSTVHKPFH